MNVLTPMPVTWAATLGSGTPCSPGLRTGSDAVSLSEIITQRTFFFLFFCRRRHLTLIDAQCVSHCSHLSSQWRSPSGIYPPLSKRKYHRDEKIRSENAFLAVGR